MCVIGCETDDSPSTGSHIDNSSLKMRASQIHHPFHSRISSKNIVIIADIINRGNNTERFLSSVPYLETIVEAKANNLTEM